MNTNGLCSCGCGSLAPIAKMTAKRFGHIKGQPCRYIRGHQARKGTPAERFDAKVRVQPDGCHEWTGYALPNGYGWFGVAKGVTEFAHRFSYESRVGTIPDGAFVLHKCDNRKCVNAEHLFLGTHADNMADMRAKGRAPIPWNRAKTHCNKGHEFSPDNTYTHNGKRHCKQCRRAQSRPSRTTRTSPLA